MLPDSSRVLKKPQVVMATLYKNRAVRIMMKVVIKRLVRTNNFPVMDNYNSDPILKCNL